MINLSFKKKALPKKHYALLYNKKKNNGGLEE